MSWALDTACTTSAIDVDPARVQSISAATPAGDERALMQAFGSLGLMATRVADPVLALETAVLPLINAGAGVAIVGRDGSRVELHGFDRDPVWLPIEAARAEIGQLGGDWVSVVSASPMSAMAHQLTPWARLRSLMHLERDDVRVVVIYAVGVGVFTLATPIAVQALVTTVAFGTLLQPILVVSVLLLAALTFQSTLNALQARVVETLQQRLFARTALDLAWRLPRVKASRADEGFGAQTVNRFFEVVTMQKTLGALLTDGISKVLQITIGLLVLAFYHPWLFAFSLTLVLLIGAVVWLPARRGLQTSIGESYAKYEVAAWLQSLASPGAVFKTEAGASLAIERADELTRKYLRARDGHFSVLFGQTMGTLGLQVFASVGLLALGGFLVVNRELTLGQLVASELIVGSVAASVGKIGKLLDNGYDLLTAADKLGHLLDEPLELPTRAETVATGAPLTLEVDVPGLALQVAAGARVAVVGPQRPALGELLAGLRVPTRGVVRIDGIETRLLAAPESRDSIALVRGDDLFEGTVLENVSVERPGVSAAAVRAALATVGLLEDVRSLPDGLDTQLSREGSLLSPAQRVQLTLARAIVAQPRLMVVCAPFEHLTPEARVSCTEALTSPLAPWTLVVLEPDAESAIVAACERVVALREES